MVDWQTTLTNSHILDRQEQYQCWFFDWLVVSLRTPEPPSRTSTSSSASFFQSFPCSILPGHSKLQPHEVRCSLRKMMSVLNEHSMMWSGIFSYRSLLNRHQSAWHQSPPERSLGLVPPYLRSLIPLLVRPWSTLCRLCPSGPNFPQALHLHSQVTELVCDPLFFQNQGSGHCALEIHLCPWHEHCLTPGGSTCPRALMLSP